MSGAAFGTGLIYNFNLVDITKLPCYPHRCSTHNFLRKFHPLFTLYYVAALCVQISPFHDVSKRINADVHSADDSL